MANLKLVHNVDAAPHTSCADSERVWDEKVLRSEVIAFAALIGKNPYSDFVLKHGRRPDAQAAATIGRLMATRVKAADGSMQPVRTAAEKTARKDAARLWKEELRRLDHIARLCAAIEDLAANTEDPSSIIDEMPAFEESLITKNLNKSVTWLIRFEQEWQSRGKQQEVGRTS